MIIGMMKGMGRMDGDLMINCGRTSEPGEMCRGLRGVYVRDYCSGYCGH